MVLAILELISDSKYYTFVFFYFFDRLQILIVDTRIEAQIFTNLPGGEFGYTY